MSGDTPTWVQYAECAGVNPDLFFPERGGDGHQARAVCAVCPVKAACLNHALDNNEKFGIFGGMGPRERRALMKRRHLKGVA